MSRTLIRPLFRQAFIQKYANGGIVGAVLGDAGGQEPEVSGYLMDGQDMNAAPDPSLDPNGNTYTPMSPGAQPQPYEASNPLGILQSLAQQTDITEKNLDGAEGLDAILTSFAGKPKSGKEARVELAQIVGRADAMNTPETVLALVQPTLALMQLAQQRAPQGGIAGAPMGVRTPEGFRPAEELPAHHPVAGFADGGSVDMQKYIDEYQQTQQALPQGYGSDPAAFWNAMAQFGAGMATGTSFAKGMAQGTQAMGPYMDKAIESKARNKNALMQYVTDRSKEDKAMTAAAQEKAAARQWEATKTAAQIQARMEEKAAEIASRKEIALLNAKSAAERDAIKHTFALEEQGVKLAGQKELAEFNASLPPKSTEKDRAAAELLKINRALSAPNLDDATRQDLEMQKGLQEKILSGNSTTVNVDMAGEKAGKEAAVKLITNYDTERAPKYAEAQTNRQNVADSIAVLEQVMAIPPTEGGFQTGLGSEWRMKLGQMATAAGVAPEDVNTWIGGAQYGELFNAMVKKINISMQSDMARGTNLTLQQISDSTANTDKTPAANKLWIDVQKATLAWNAKNDEYLSQSVAAWGTDNPNTLYRLDPTRTPGFTPNTKPVSKITKDELYTADGRPALSYDQYVQWRSLNEPAISKEVKNQILSYANKPNPNSSPFPNLPGAPSSGTATVGDVLKTPGTNLTGSKPQYPDTAKDAKGLLYKLDRSTMEYVSPTGQRFPADKVIK